MAKYIVTGVISLEVQVSIDDDSVTTKVDAIKEGSKLIKDFYNMDIVGGYHDSNKCKISLDAKRVKRG